VFSACPFSAGGFESQVVLPFFLLYFLRPTQFKEALNVNNTVKSYLVCCGSVQLLPVYVYTNFEKLLNIKTRARTKLFIPEQFNIYALPHFQVLEPKEQVPTLSFFFRNNLNLYFHFSGSNLK
jgi:hypothetical protein